MLHITNGDLAADLLRVSGLRGEVLAWRDVLHEGPVVANLPHEALSRVRADFIASMGWNYSDDVGRQFALRDARLDVSRADNEVVLWFEHDLYDQLQLMQVLAWYARSPYRPAALSIVQTDSYLGELTPSAFGALYATRKSISQMMLAHARAVWEMFASHDPQRLAERAKTPIPDLPYLAQALQRLLEELPSAYNGLARSEQQILEALSRGTLKADALFRRAHHEREPALFLGDTVFASYLARLAAGYDPLITCDDPHCLAQLRADPRGPFRAGASFALSPTGEAALAGELDWVRHAGLDRWLGGVYLHGHAVPWRWDRERHRLAGAR
jgi:Domain of unknown function (DUF1835)